MLKQYQINMLGDESLIVKRNKQKMRLWYYSLNKFDDFEKPVIVGYTSLKQCRKKKKQEIGTLLFGETPIAPIYEEKSSLKSVKGYFQVGKNEFVGIERPCLLLLILPILLALLLLLLFAFCGRSDRLPIADNPWTPTIDQHISDSTATAEKPTVPQIKIAGFSSWHVPAEQTENIPIALKNPDGNPCYFSFAIVLKDTNETIYQSDMVPPGEAIRKINISKALPEGTYPAIVQIRTNELETGRAMNSADLNLTITVG